MTRILVAGLATVDFLFDVEQMPTRAEKYRAGDAMMVGGGGAANAAVSIARLGGAASLAAPVGKDRIGEMILSDLKAEGVDTALVQCNPDGRSAFSSVLIDAAGERQIVNFRGSEPQCLPDLDAVPPCDAVLVDTRFPALTTGALAVARKQGVPGIVDGEHPVAVNDLTDATHIAFSAQGLVGLTGNGDLAAALHAVGTQVSAWVCVTDGANGVLYLKDGVLKTLPVARIDPVDTLAAGDVWHGAFALHLGEGADEEAAMAFASAAATLKCGHRGGRAGCPDRKTVETFLREQGRAVRP